MTEVSYEEPYTILPIICMIHPSFILPNHDPRSYVLFFILCHLRSPKHLLQGSYT